MKVKRRMIVTLTINTNELEDLLHGAKLAAEQAVERGDTTRALDFHALVGGLTDALHGR